MPLYHLITGLVSLGATSLAAGGRASCTARAALQGGSRRAVATDGGSRTAKQDQFIGAYTPVTKRLWAERLQWNTQQQTQPAPADDSTGAPEPQAPQATSVVYPFTQDSGLVECERFFLHSSCILKLLPMINFLLLSLPWGSQATQPPRCLPRARHD
jgi:hypothetical protein